MPLVGEDRTRVRGLSELIAVIALHMDRAATQEPALNEGPHAARRMPELIVVPGCYLEPFFTGDCNQRSGIVLAEREWFLHIDVAAPIQAKPGDIEMAIRRSRDMHNVGLGVAKEFPQVAEMLFDGEPLVELLRHQRLPVTDADNLASLDPLNLRRMIVGDLAAAHDGDLKHRALRSGTLQSSA